MTQSEAAVLEVLARHGFTASFMAVPGGLRLIGSGKTFPPEDIAIRAHWRFEGISDPDDMSIVYAIETTDGTRGTIVDAFGVYANPVLAMVLDHIQIRQESGILAVT